MILNWLQDLQLVQIITVLGLTTTGTGLILRRARIRTRQRVQAAVAAYLALQHSQHSV